VSDRAEQGAAGPPDEGAQAALIARLAAPGRRWRCVACFEPHRDALRRELDIAPSPATRQLVQNRASKVTKR
jgi:DNA-binding SARP family transcriptional activator